MSMRMVRNFLIGTALSITAFAVAGFSATASLNFGTGTAPAGGSLTWNSGTNFVTASGVLLEALTATNTLSDAGNWELSGSTNNTSSYAVLNINADGSFAILGGVIGCSFGCSATTLPVGGSIAYTTTLVSGGAGAITESNLVRNTSTGAISFNINTSTSLSESASLLSDFGFGTSQAFSLIGSYISGTGAAGTGTTAYTASSDAVVLTATPEPVSLFLTGTGLLAVGLLARKKKVTRE